MKLSTVKLLVPIVAVTIQSNSASTVIPPYLDHMRIPVALIGSLISLGPIFALMARLPIGMLYSRSHARSLVSLAILAMGLTNYCYSFAASSLVLCPRPLSQRVCLQRRDDPVHGVLRRFAGAG